MFVVLVQMFVTPAAPHVDAAVHGAQGATPDAENVVPVAHSWWHTVFDVLVQAVCTPYVHVASTMHAAHGEPPEEDQVEPARHGVGHSEIEAQSVS